MSLKDLSTATLISILAPWLDPKAQRPMLQMLKRSSPYLDDLDEAEELLVATHAPSDGEVPGLAAVSARALALDAKHDRKLRGIVKLCEGFGEYTDDEELRASLTTFVTELVGPQGLRIITASHVDEATNAKLADDRLTEPSKELAKTISFGGFTLAKLVRGWQTVSAALGEAEAERVELLATAPAVVTRASAHAARNSCIQTMNLFLAAFARDTSENLALRKTILTALQAKLDQAAEHARQVPEPEPEPEPAPAPPPVVPPPPAAEAVDEKPAAVPAAPPPAAKPQSKTPAKGKPKRKR